MSKYFLTKTWGFSPLTYPVSPFSTLGAMTTYLHESETEDWVLIVGTTNDATDEHERGKLLGKVRLGQHVVDTEAILNQIGTEIEPKEYDLEGRYKWPYGLPMLEAYKFDDTPLAKDIFGSGLPGLVWAISARLLSKEEGLPDDITSTLDALPCTKVDIHEIPEFRNIEFLQLMLSANNQNSPSGPPPSGDRAGSVSKLGKPVVYLLELDGVPQKKIHKIGYTNDIERRLKELNKGLIHGVTGLTWKTVECQPQISGVAAYTCEQLVHSQLTQWRVPGEREIYEITRKNIVDIYHKVIYDVDYMKPEVQSDYLTGYNDLVAPLDDPLSDPEAESDSF